VTQGKGEAYEKLHDLHGREGLFEGLRDFETEDGEGVVCVLEKNYQLVCHLPSSTINVPSLRGWLN
jgi:hypothetical protein